MQPVTFSNLGCLALSMGLPKNSVVLQHLCACTTPETLLPVPPIYSWGTSTLGGCKIHLTYCYCSSGKSNTGSALGPGRGITWPRRGPMLLVAGAKGMKHLLSPPGR